jgi:cytochrome b561
MSWPFLDPALHWGMALLFCWQFGSRWWASTLPEAHPLQFHLSGLHSVSGYLILVFAAWRVIRRLWNGRPPLPPGSVLERTLAVGVHWSLYVLMFAQPVTGIWAAREISDGPGHDVHAIGSWIILALIAAHMTAALWHQFVKRDATLGRMILG